MKMTYKAGEKVISVPVLEVVWKGNQLWALVPPENDKEFNQWFQIDDKKTVTITE